MPTQPSTLYRFPGDIRIATVLLALIGLIFIIVAITIHRTDDFIAYEAVVIDFIAITTV